MGAYKQETTTDQLLNASNIHNRNVGGFSKEVLNTNELHAEHCDVKSQVLV